MTSDSKQTDGIAGFVGEIRYDGLDGPVPASLYQAGERLKAARPLRAKDLQTYLHAAASLSDWTIRTEVQPIPGEARGVVLLVHMQRKAQTRAARPSIAAFFDASLSWLRARKRLLLYTGGAFLAGIILVLLALVLLRGPTEEAVSILYGDWRMNCPALTAPDKNCALVQEVSDSSRRPVARFAVEPKGGQEMFALLVPHNVFLPNGLRLELDGKQRPAPYYICNAVGCIALLKLDRALEKLLRESKQGSVIFQDMQGKAQSSILSPRGFGEGLKAYRREMRLRGFWWQRLLP